MWFCTDFQSFWQLAEPRRRCRTLTGLDLAAAGSAPPLPPACLPLAPLALGALASFPALPMPHVLPDVRPHAPAAGSGADSSGVQHGTAPRSACSGARSGTP